MISRDSLFAKFPEFAEGMSVQSQDGESLGKVTFEGEDHFVVSKGLFFPKEFSFRYDDVVELRDGEVIVGHGQSDLSGWRDESYAGWSQIDSANELNEDSKGHSSESASTSSELKSDSSETVTIPVMEDQLEARKTVSETGGARIRKVVHTELRHLTVPVMKEELHIERRSVNEDSAPDMNDTKLFSGETIVVPLREEQVELVKHPVVKEEVLVSKESHVEQRELEGEARKEEVEIDDLEKMENRKKIA